MEKPWIGRALFRIGLATVVALGLATGSGCMMGPTVTPADLERNGTKVYPEQDSKRVVKASALALRTLGYEVVLEDVASGRIKTAPKVVQVIAVGSSYTARAYANELAWSLEINGAGERTVIKAIPRASTNGQPIDMSSVNASYMEQLFATLWSEIDSNLGRSGSSPSAHAPKTPPSGEPRTPAAEKPKAVLTAI
jgi:hypothetical protein